MNVTKRRGLDKGLDNNPNEKTIAMRIDGLRFLPIANTRTSIQSYLDYPMLRQYYRMR